MRTLRLPLILLIAGVAAILYLVYQFVVPRNTVLVPAPGGTYTEGVVGAPQSVNPLLCAPTSVDHDLCSLVFRGLTRVDQSGGVAPDLADISVDSQTSYTARIRQDARWEDGVNVTSDDVVFTTQLLQDQNFPGDPGLKRLWQSVRVNKIDENTVRFELTQPYARFLDFTSVGLLPRHILSGTIAADLGQIPYNLRPKGNGAWRVTDVSTANGRISAVTLEPSPYAPVKPKIARLVIRYYSNAQSMIDAYRTGDLDGMASINPSDAARVSALADTVIHTAPQSRFVGLYFNLRNNSGATFLADKSVRQALMLALDRELIVREALGGRAVLANTPFIQGTWAFHSGARVYSRDLGQARQLLRNAGYELRAASTSSAEVWQKDGETIGFTLTTPDSENMRAVAELAAQQWRELGVQVAVQPVRNIQRGSLQPRQFQVVLVETLLDGDPDPYSLWHGSQSQQGRNFTGWDNAEANDLLTQARVNGDRATRASIYARFQDLFAEELPALMLYYPAYQYAMAVRVRDVQIAPIVYDSDRLRTLNVWMVNTQRVLPAEATAQAASR